jgi:2-(3-amino-3-carboxypropyl)histidine synthase
MATGTSDGLNSSETRSVQEISLELFHGYTFNVSELYSWVNSNNYKFIGFQFPEGLRKQGVELIRRIEPELGVNVIILADPCFGACDVNLSMLESLGIDALVHFGHAEIPECTPPNIPVKYIELQGKVDPSELIQESKNINKLKSEFHPELSIGLVANVQFISYLDDIQATLEKENFQVFIGTGEPRVKHPGQVLGCNFSAAKNIQEKVNGYLFVGDGRFHPVGISLVTNKKVLAFNPFDNTLENMSTLKDKILRQRSAAIAKAKDCLNFGILISIKPGQIRLEYAFKIREKLRRYDRLGILLALDNITPNQIDYLPFDAYINLACPRLAIDDYHQYKKPLITPIELDIMLKERNWENYLFDEI